MSLYIPNLAKQYQKNALHKKKKKIVIEVTPTLPPISLLTHLIFFYFIATIYQLVLTSTSFFFIL